MTEELNPEDVFKDMEKEKQQRLEEVKVMPEVKAKKVSITAERVGLAEKVLALLVAEGVPKEQQTKVLSRAYNLAKKQ